MFNKSLSNGRGIFSYIIITVFGIIGSIIYKKYETAIETFFKEKFKGWINEYVKIAKENKNDSNMTVSH